MRQNDLTQLQKLLFDKIPQSHDFEDLTFFTKVKLKRRNGDKNGGDLGKNKKMEKKKFS